MWILQEIETRLKNIIGKYFRKKTKSAYLKYKRYILKNFPTHYKRWEYATTVASGIVFPDAWLMFNIYTSGVVILDAPMTSKMSTFGITYPRRIKNVDEENVRRRLFSTSCWWNIGKRSPDMFLPSFFSTFFSVSGIGFPTSLSLSPTFLWVENVPTSCSVRFFQKIKSSRKSDWKISMV